MLEQHALHFRDRLILSKPMKLRGRSNFAALDLRQELGILAWLDEDLILWRDHHRHR